MTTRLDAPTVTLEWVHQGGTETIPDLIREVAEAAVQALEELSVTVSVRIIEPDGDG